MLADIEYVESVADQLHFFLRLRQFRHPDRPRVTAAVEGSLEVGGGMVVMFGLRPGSRQG